MAGATLDALFEREIADLNTTASPLSDWGIDAADLRDQLVQMCSQAPTGISPRAFLIKARDLCRARDAKMSELIDDEGVVSVLQNELGQATEQARAGTYAVLINRFLALANPSLSVVTLGGARGDSLAGLLDPVLLQHRWLVDIRKMNITDGVFSPIDRLISVDRSMPSADVVRARLKGRDDQLDLFEEIESRGDFEGRLLRIESEIATTAAAVVGGLPSVEGNVLVALSNVAYQLSPEARDSLFGAADFVIAAIREAGHEVIAAVQMDTWQAFYEEKPDVVIAGIDVPVKNPAMITVGSTFLGERTEIARMDGTVGKPFMLRNFWKGDDWVYVDGL
jgi:hypothetical protein